MAPAPTGAAPPVADSPAAAAGSIAGPTGLSISPVISGVRADVPTRARQCVAAQQTRADARPRPTRQRVVGQRVRTDQAQLALVLANSRAGSAAAAHLAKHRGHLLRWLGDLLHRAAQLRDLSGRRLQLARVTLPSLAGIPINGLDVMLWLIPGSRMAVIGSIFSNIVLASVSAS